MLVEVHGDCVLGVQAPFCFAGVEFFVFLDKIVDVIVWSLSVCRIAEGYLAEEKKSLSIGEKSMAVGQRLFKGVCEVGTFPKVVSMLRSFRRRNSQAVGQNTVEITVPRSVPKQLVIGNLVRIEVVAFFAKLKALEELYALFIAGLLGVFDVLLNH